MTTAQEDLKLFIEELRKEGIPAFKRRTRLPVGTTVTSKSPSIHAGHKGVIVADYINMYLVQSLDKDYVLSHTNSIGTDTYFQIDARYIKAVK